MGVKDQGELISVVGRCMKEQGWMDGLMGWMV